MKKFLSLLSFVASFASAQSLNVMIFNIRYNTANDSLNAWPYRKDLVASQVLFHQVNLLGVQEALHEQIIELKQRLPKFTYLGVGRDDGKERGEYSAIFYDTLQLQLLQSQTFWLSTTPNEVSKGWDAALPRIVTDKPTPFVSGPERGARAGNLPVVFASIVKPKRGYYHATFEIATENAADLPVGELTLQYAAFMEKTIRKNPEMWLWSHRRWKQKWSSEHQHNWIGKLPAPPVDI